MNGKRWKRSNTTVYNIGYHLIWCPEYRSKVLVGQVADRLKELLLQKAREIEVEIVQMEAD
nr:transposase [Caldicoprobacter algeriensis]